MVCCVCETRLTDRPGGIIVCRTNPVQSRPVSNDRDSHMNRPCVPPPRLEERILMRDMAGITECELLFVA